MIQNYKKTFFWSKTKVNSYLLSGILLIISLNAFSQINNLLSNQRMEVMKRYIHYLGKGNYKAISQLFTKQAVAVSSSGKSDNPRHFYKTLFNKTISSPNSSLINLFEGKRDPDMMTAYFDFSWRNNEGKQVSAKFLDLFLFEKGTLKIKAVFVFSNTFQNDIMKQLEKQ